MALTNWGYKRRYWTRKSNLYAAGEARTWETNSYVTASGEARTDTAKIGSHSFSESTAAPVISGVQKYQVTQHIYNDCVYIVFPIPAAAVNSAAVSFYVPAQAYTSKIKARRITAAVGSGNAFPSMAATNAVELTTSADGATLTFDVTGIINDAISAGAWYGIAFTSQDTDPWYTRKNTITFDAVQLGGSIGDGLANMRVVIDGVAHRITAGKVIVDGSAKKIVARKIYANGGWNG